MTLPWIRLWADMPTDPKFRTIARASGQPLITVLGVFMFMLTDAARSDELGVTSAPDEDIASALDLEAEQVAAIRAAMQDRVLSGAQLTGWERRQPVREDSSAGRMAAYRSRRKGPPTPLQPASAEPAPAVTHGDAGDGPVTHGDAGDGAVTQSDASDGAVTQGDAPEESRGEETNPEPTARSSGFPDGKPTEHASVRRQTVRPCPAPPRKPPNQPRRGLSAAVLSGVERFPGLPRALVRTAIQATQRYARGDGKGSGDAALGAGLEAVCQALEVRVLPGFPGPPLAEPHAFARYLLRGVVPRFNAARAEREHAARLRSDTVPRDERIAGDAVTAVLLDALELGIQGMEPERARLMADMIRERVALGYSLRQARTEVREQMLDAGL